MQPQPPQTDETPPQAPQGEGGERRADDDGPQLEQDIRLTWRTLIALGIPAAYLQELCVDALRAVARDADGNRTDAGVGLAAVYEAAVQEGAHFGRRFVDRPQAPSRLAGAQMSAQEREVLQALSDALSELTMAEQEAFRLFEVEGFSLEQVGEMLTISPQFAQAQLQSARRRLRRSRAAAGLPIQRPGVFAAMRLWHSPTEAQLLEVRDAALRALADGGDARGKWAWLGPVVALLLSAAMLGGLWLAASQMAAGR